MEFGVSEDDPMGVGVETQEATPTDSVVTCVELVTEDEAHCWEVKLGEDDCEGRKMSNCLMGPKTSTSDNNSGA